ncbi:MAG: hypothetical protein ACYDAO_04500 [Thermoplasmataceae archaeon]
MPHIGINTGGVTIMGSRTTLPFMTEGLEDVVDISPLLVDIGSGTVTSITGYEQTNIFTNASNVSSGSKNINMKKYQDLVVDTYFSAITGSLLITIYGVEPQSLNTTATILAGDWLTGSSGVGERLQVSGPSGAYLNVAWTVVGSISGLYLTAEESA